MAQKRRLLVDSGIEAQLFRPVTSPVDTFVRPTDGNQLGQVARALSNFAPSLMRFSDALAEQQKARDEVQAEADAQKAISQQIKTYDEAIKAGIIRNDQSPWYRYYFNRTVGKSAAYDYQAFLEESMKKELPDTATVEEFEAWEAQKRAQFIDENGLAESDAALASFGASVTSLVGGLKVRHGNASAVRRDEELKENSKTTHIGIIRSGRVDGKSLEDIAAETQTEFKTLVQQGISEVEAGKVVAESIKLYVHDTGDTEVLALFDLITDSEGNPLGNTSYGITAKREAEELAEAEAEEDQAQSKEDLWRELEIRLAEDPEADVSDILERYREVDPTGVSTMEDRIDAKQSEARAADDDTFADLVIQADGLASGRPALTRSRAAELLRGNKINLGQYEHLINRIAERERRVSAGQTPLNKTPQYRMIEDSVKAMFPTGVTNRWPELGWAEDAAKDEWTRLFVEQGSKIENPAEFARWMSETEEYIARKYLGVNAEALRNYREFQTVASTEMTSDGNRWAYPGTDWRNRRVIEPHVAESMELDIMRFAGTGRHPENVMRIARRYGITTPQDLDEFINIQKDESLTWNGRE